MATGRQGTDSPPKDRVQPPPPQRQGNQETPMIFKYRPQVPMAEYAAWEDALRSEFLRRLEDHYRRNDHHPEHHALPLACRMELTCDLLGTVFGWAHDAGLTVDLAQARAFVEDEAWPGWRHAVVEYLPPRAERAPRIEPTRDWFELQELEQLDRGGDDGFVWTYDLACVRWCIRRFMNHKDGVAQVWQEIVREHDPRFAIIEERIQKHDVDKFRRDMVCAYTKHLAAFEPRFIKTDRFVADLDALPGWQEKRWFVPIPRAGLTVQPQVKTEAGGETVKTETPEVSVEPSVETEVSMETEVTGLVKTETPEVSVETVKTVETEVSVEPVKVEE